MLTPEWRKSTRSNINGACVEARLDDGQVQVRDTKLRRSPILEFPPAAWQHLLAGIAAGAYDLPA